MLGIDNTRKEETQNREKLRDVNEILEPFDEKLRDVNDILKYVNEKLRDDNDILNDVNDVNCLLMLIGQCIVGY